MEQATSFRSQRILRGMWVGVLAAGVGALAIGAFVMAEDVRESDRVSALLDAALALQAEEGARSESNRLLDQADKLLVGSLDARGLELRAHRAMIEGTAHAYRSAARDLEDALTLAPIRPELHLRLSLLAFLDPAAGGDVGERLIAWHRAAPYHPPTQMWRLKIGANAWARLSPEVRAIVLSDVDVLCRRWGQADVQRQVSGAPGSARLAISLRLSELEGRC